MCLGMQNAVCPWRLHCSLDVCTIWLLSAYNHWVTQQNCQNIEFSALRATEVKNWDIKKILNVGALSCPIFEPFLSKIELSKCYLRSEGYKGGWDDLICIVRHYDAFLVVSDFSLWTFSVFEIVSFILHIFAFCVGNILMFWSFWKHRSFSVYGTSFIDNQRHIMQSTFDIEERKIYIFTTFMIMLEFTCPWGVYNILKGYLGVMMKIKLKILVDERIVEYIVLIQISFLMLTVTKKRKYWAWICALERATWLQSCYYCIIPIVRVQNQGMWSRLLIWTKA